MVESASCTMAGTQVGISRARFYILLLFSLFTMEQCANWNTFGPIAASAKVRLLYILFFPTSCLDSILLVKCDNCKPDQYWPVWLHSVCGSLHLSSLQKSQVGLLHTLSAHAFILMIQVVCDSWMLHDHDRCLAKVHPPGVPHHIPIQLHNSLLPLCLLHLHSRAHSHVSSSPDHSLLVSTQGEEYSNLCGAAIQCSGSVLHIGARDCCRSFRGSWDSL